jgi:abhydrolase domain-containing protein 6
MEKIKRLLNHTVVFSLFLLPVLWAITAYSLPGLVQRKIAVDGGDIAYYSIGKGKPVLLLHGFLANKEKWLRFIHVIGLNKKAPYNQYQFIIPDLPGFGHSDYPKSIYNLTANSLQLSQIKVLHDFLTKLSIRKPLNIAGNSLGGLIMTLYAEHYPNDVKTLAYIGSPAGFVDFSNTLIQNTIRRGINPIAPVTLTGLKTKFSLLAVNYKYFMPNDHTLQKIVLPKIIKNSAKYNLMYKMTNQPKYRYILSHPIKLYQPVLILWGRQDYIFGKPYHAYQLAGSFINAHSVSVKIISQAGHDMPQESSLVLSQVTSDYLNFLSRS